MMLGIQLCDSHLANVERPHLLQSLISWDIKEIRQKQFSFEIIFTQNICGGPCHLFI